MNLYYTSNISWQLIDQKVYIINELTTKMLVFENILKEFRIRINKYSNFNLIVNDLHELYNVDIHILKEDLIESLSFMETNNLVERR